MGETSSISHKGITSSTIDWLRFALICGVVLLHSGENGVSGDDLYSTLCIIVSHGICKIAVPCYFLISGYLFYSKLTNWDTSIWIDKIRKRVQSLVIPFFLWNIIAFIIGYAYGNIRSVVNGGEIESIITSLENVGWLNIFWGCTWGCPIDYPLWFLRDLIIIVGLTPIIFLFCKKCKVPGLIIIFILFCFTKSRDLEGLFFFILGGYMRIYSKDLVATLRKYNLPSLVISSILLVAIVLTYNDYHDIYVYLKYIYVLFGTICTISLTSICLEKGIYRVHTSLTKCSFFIFCSHAILILHDISHFIMIHLFNTEIISIACIVLFMKAALAIAICILIYHAMLRLMPKTLAILNGGRI